MGKSTINGKLPEGSSQQSKCQKRSKVPGKFHQFEPYVFGTRLSLLSFYNSIKYSVFILYNWYSHSYWPYKFHKHPKNAGSGTTTGPDENSTPSLGLAPLGKTAALGRRTVLKGTSDEFDRPCRIWESLPKAAGTAVSLNLKRKNLDRTIHHTQTQKQHSGAWCALSVLWHVNFRYSCWVARSI